MELKSELKVLHTLEYLAMVILGKDWKNDLVKQVRSGRKQGQTLILPENNSE